MFKSKESVGPMIGGAVIGVAVGMLIERIRSPRSAQQPANNGGQAEIFRQVCCENVKKCSNNLQVPSHHCKDRSRHHRRSRSACRSKDAEKRCRHLSISAALQQDTKTSVSESDLRSRSADKRYSRRKLDIDARSREDFRDPSTDYLQFGPKVRKNLRHKTDGGFDRPSGREAVATTSTEYLPIEVKSKPEFASDVNDRKADLSSPMTIHYNVKAECDAEDKVFDSESRREFIRCGSTEYLKPCGLKNYSEYAKPASLSDIAGRESSAMHPECSSTSIGCLADTETANCSINATCDTLDKKIDFDSYNEDRTERKDEQEGLDTKEFVTLPTYDEAGNPVSTEHIEHESV